jgi:hypothetical protein
MSWVSRIVNVFRSAHVEDDLDDELRFHLEEKTRRLIGGGLPPDVAAREARRRLGNPLATKERSRDVKLLPWLDALVRDVRFGFASCARMPLSQLPPSYRSRLRWARGVGMNFNFA